MDIHNPKPWRGALALAAALTISAALSPPARADERGREVEALMGDYIVLWNAHDAHAIWTRVYRLDAAQPLHSEADLAAEFAGLRAQGYDHSDMASAHACLLTPATATAVMRFSRLKTDGTPMPPKDRATLYLLRKFDDGWRITARIGMDASARLDCASAASR
jgi:ketosteroid isomerase-like protein